MSKLEDIWSVWLPLRIIAGVALIVGAVLLFLPGAAWVFGMIVLAALNWIVS